MWASMAIGVPTINGYSGYAPHEWEGFFAADFDPEIDLTDVLSDWELTHGLSPDRVQWIGADCPRKAKVRRGSPDPAGRRTEGLRIPAKVRRGSPDPAGRRTEGLRIPADDLPRSR